MISFSFPSRSDPLPVFCLHRSQSNLPTNANMDLLISLHGPSIQDSKICSLLYKPPGTNSGFVRLKARAAEGRNHKKKYKSLNSKSGSRL